MYSPLKKKIISITLSEQGTQQVDGAKIVEQSMEFGRAVGFSMEGTQLILNIDTKRCGNFKPLDVLEKMMQNIWKSKKTAA